ncbi:MAG: phosphodiester glycosidase family protein [Planctomycetia bacterium]|nr:phosphodiester glycosidase family protein [Planctomycetia bacterium]
MKVYGNRFFLVPCALLFLVLSSTNLIFGQNNLKKSDWSSLFQGIDLATGESEEPLQKVYILRIDTQANGISFYSTGRNDNFEDNVNETNRQTVVDFLKENNLAVAVNANFYNPFTSFTQRNPGPSNVIGLAISEGVVVSTTAEGFPSFIVHKDGTKEIRSVSSDESLDHIQTAVSGNKIILQNGEVLVQEDKSRHPRTGLGISEDNRFVYLMTIDGRQEGYSNGATYEEVGNWLKEFGSYNGLNLDGGGSTTMVQRDSDGSPKILNRHSGVLRHNANAIGVRALAL